ncbi:uncharacterized protein LOC143518873 isoform X2 [Brachyhypopomus gauderio]|uniref:uncharacterized protein LOC143518873 isoform X2 n=1 Tax=Brachyhypopomus gauderio TaxID=698409 RepID=UPI0040414D4F
MFDYIWHGKFWTVDAAKDDGTLGRLVNDNHINPNYKIKRIVVEGRPWLCLFASRDINTREEITYNYGDGDCPWRSKVTKTKMAADSNCLESDCATGDDQHCTDPQQQESPFSNTVTKTTTAADSNCLESDCATGDDQHCTDPQQQESSFSNTV